MSTTRIRTRGKVKWFCARRGFGFAARAGAPAVFIHTGAMKSDGVVELKPGTELDFIVDLTRHGPVAHEIHLV